MNRLAIALSLTLACMAAARDGTPPQTFKIESNLKAAVAKVDITPPEPFVEQGFRLEKAVADRAIPIIVGYANGNIGYICTKKAHAEGGYEPNNSRSGPEAEEVLIAESLKLADRVIGDVFESFAPLDARSRKDRK